MTATSAPARRRLAPGTVVAASALVWSLVAFVGFATLPFYSGSSVSTDSDGTVVAEDTSSTIIEHEGSGVIVLLLVPTVLALVGLAGAAFHIRAVSIGAAGLALAFCLLGLMSIGLFYLPTAVLLVVAAVRSAGHPR